VLLCAQGLSNQAVAEEVGTSRQTQALERTQPLLPLGLGYVEGVTHGYLRRFDPPEDPETL